MGYNRHMPYAVVYAPANFGGLGLNNMKYEQGLAHIIYTIKHR
jgi:hypothetical protein